MKNKKEKIKKEIKLFQTKKFYVFSFLILFFITIFIFLTTITRGQSSIIEKMIYSNSLNDKLRRELDIVFSSNKEIQKKINKINWRTYKEENGFFKIDLPEFLTIINNEKENLKTLRYDLMWKTEDENEEMKKYFEDFNLSISVNSGAGEISKDFCKTENKAVIDKSKPYYYYCNQNVRGFETARIKDGKISSARLYHQEIVNSMIVGIVANVNPSNYDEALMIFKKIVLSLGINKKAINRIEKIRADYLEQELKEASEKKKTGADAMLWGAKPVIYFYPPEITDVNIKLELNGEVKIDYPEYNNEIQGWNILAYPSGKIINRADELEYSYLFWEGSFYKNIADDITEGFVVFQEDTRNFLREKLSILGLTPKEYNEFIVYWYPIMQKNKYNLVYFAGEEYTNEAKLTITPTPDSLLRVFMIFKPLEEKIEIKEQELDTFKREGFSVVEWGGMEVK